MIIEHLVVGPIQANCYIVGCDETKEAAVIDPGDDADIILAKLKKSSLAAKYLINTHGHFDHVGANKVLKEKTGGAIVIHRADAHMLGDLSKAAATWGMRVQDSPPPDMEVDEGDILTVGSIELKVLHTPGHSPGGISLVGKGAVFVGDTLFMGSIGRTDFPGGDYQTLISSVRDKLFPLGDDMTVYCGHGPSTTIGRERKFNPFFNGEVTSEP